MGYIPSDSTDDLLAWADSLEAPPTPKARGKALSQPELEDVLREAGWDEKHIPVMSAIGMAESSRDAQGRALTTSFNPGIGHGGKPTKEKSHGLWQINVLAHPQYDPKALQDPVYNAKAALDVFRKQGLGAWGAYTDGRYKQFYKGRSVRPTASSQPLDENAVWSDVDNILARYGQNTAPNIESLPMYQAPGEEPQEMRPNITEIPMSAPLKAPKGLPKVAAPLKAPKGLPKVATPVTDAVRQGLAALVPQLGPQAQQTQDASIPENLRHIQTLGGYSPAPPQTLNAPPSPEEELASRIDTLGGYVPEGVDPEAYKQYQQFRNDTGMPEGPDTVNAFIDAQRALETMPQFETRTHQPRQARQTQSRQSHQAPPQTGFAERVQPNWKTADKDLTDEQLMGTHLRYRVDLKNVRGNKTEYATNAVRRSLMKEYGLTADQAKQVVGTVKDVQNDEPFIIANIPRGDLASVIGAENVKEDYKKSAVNAKFSVYEQIRDKDRPSKVPVGQSSFERSSGDDLMEQAKANVQQDPFAGSDYEKAVQDEYKRLKRYALSPDEEAEARRVADDIGRELPEGAGSFFASGLAGAGRLLTGVAGAIRMGARAVDTQGRSLSEIDEKLPDWVVQLSKWGTQSATAEEIYSKQHPGLANEALRITGGMAADLPRWMVFSKLPGGGGVIFTIDASTQSAGRGEKGSQIVTDTAKGALTDGIFRFGPKVQQAAEGYFLKAAKNPVFDAGIANTPKERLAAKLFGIGARVGYIGGATATQARVVDDAPTVTALSNGVTMALTDLAMHAPDGFKGLIGGVFRATKAGKDGKPVTENYTVEADGTVRRLKEAVPDKYVDIDMVFDPETQMYRAKGDTTPVREKSVPAQLKPAENALPAGKQRGSEPPPPPSEEAIPMRGDVEGARKIDTPDPEAVKKVSLDTRARKVTDALRGKDFVPADDVAKLAKLNTVHAEDTIAQLYKAGMVEITPDNKVRLIGETKPPSLYERITNEKTPPVEKSASVAPNENVPAEAPKIDPEKAKIAERFKGKTIEHPVSREPKKYEAELEAQAPKEESAKSVTSKTKLDALLDTVKQGKKELTLDTEGYTQEQKDRIESAAKDRGFDVSSDGRFILIRDMSPAAKSKMVSEQVDANEDAFYEKPAKKTIKDLEREENEIVANWKGSADDYIRSFGYDPKDVRHPKTGNVAWEKMPKMNARQKMALSEMDANEKRAAKQDKPVKRSPGEERVRKVILDTAAKMEPGEQTYINPTIHSKDGKGITQTDPFIREAGLVPVKGRLNYYEKPGAKSQIVTKQVDDNADAFYEKLAGTPAVSKSDVLRGDMTLAQVRDWADRNNTALGDAQKQWRQLQNADKPKAMDGSVKTSPTTLTTSTLSGPKRVKATPRDYDGYTLYVHTTKKSGQPHHTIYTEKGEFLEDGPSNVGLDVLMKNAVARIRRQANRLPDLAPSKLTPLTKSQIKRALDKGNKIIRPLKLGDFYEFVDDDADIAHSILKITKTHRNRDSERPIPMAGVPYYSYENAKAELEKAGFTVGEPIAGKNFADAYQEYTSAAATPSKGITPLTKSQIKRSLADGASVADVAKRHGLTEEQVKSIPALGEKGEYGQTSYMLRRQFLSPDSGSLLQDTAQAIVPDALGADTKEMANAILDTVSEKLGKSRSSRLDDKDWNRYLNENADKLPLETVKAVERALAHQAEWFKKRDFFVKSLKGVNYSGIENFDSINTYQDLPRKVRLEVKKYGQEAGLSEDAIKDVFSRALSEYRQGEADRRRGDEKSDTASKESGGEPEEDGIQLSQVGNPGFYSQAERIIEQKMPNKASIVQIKGILSPNNGVKKEELDWLDINSFLRENPNPTKQDVLDYIRAHNAKVEVVMHGQAQPPDIYWTSIYDNTWLTSDQLKPDTEYQAVVNDARTPLRIEVADDGTVTQRYLGETTTYPSIEQAQTELSNDWMENNPSTKFSKYTLPGGENYRELLLVMPPKDNTVVQRRLDEINDEMSVLSAEYAQTQPQHILRFKSSEELAAKASRLREQMAKLEVERSQLKEQNNKGYKSSHWDEPNVLAHVRFDDRDGGETMHVAEIQSDWHQAGRKKGYKGVFPQDVLDAAVKGGMSKEQATKDIRFLMEEPLSTDGRDTGAQWGRLIDATKDSNIDLNAVFHDRTDIPNAPFKSSWPLLAFKHILKYAVENGYKRITWDTGATQFDRWGSERIDWKEVGSSKDGTRKFIVSAQEQYGGNAGGIGIDIENEARERGELLEQSNQTVTSIDDLKRVLRETLSRERTPTEIDTLANKIWNRMQTEREGTSLPRKEGMEDFYDSKSKIGGMVNDVNKYLKKFGGKVEAGTIHTEGIVKRENDGINHVPRADLENLIAKREQELRIINRIPVEKQTAGERSRVQEVTAEIEKIRAQLNGTPAHSVTITPAMKELVKDQPLFNKDDEALAKELARYKGLGNLANVARFEAKDGVLTYKNAQAGAIVQHVLGAAKNVKNYTNITGGYSKGGAKRIAATAKALYGDEIGKIFADAIDPKYGDIDIKPGFMPEVGKGTGQEEDTHRADERSGVAYIKDYVRSKDYLDAYRHLRKGAYKGESRSSIHKEIIGKLGRDDAPEALGLSQEATDRLHTLHIENVYNAGIAPNELRTHYKGISNRTERFIENVERKHHGHVAEGAEPQRSGADGSAIGNQRAIRPEGNPRGTETLTREPDRFAKLRQTEANSRRGEGTSLVPVNNDFRDSHAAPGNSGESLEWRQENGGDYNLTEVAHGHHNQPDDYFSAVGPRYYGYDDPVGKSSLAAINRAKADILAGKKATITAYRAVPKSVKANSLMNGDWVSFSHQYAIDHGEHRFGEGEYRIIKQKVRPEDVWWDGNDINEWGYDAPVTSEGTSLTPADKKWFDNHPDTSAETDVQLARVSDISAALDKSPFIRKYIKSRRETGVKDIILNVRKAGLLSSLKTHFINNLSNASFAGTEEAVMRPIAAMADIAASAVTGERTVQMPNPKAMYNSFRDLVKTPEYKNELEDFARNYQKSGVSNMWSIIRNGDTKTHMDKLQVSETSSGFPLIDAYVNYSFRTLSAEDALFKSYAFRRSLEEQAKMTAITDARKSKGLSVKGRTEQLLKNPSPHMQMKAIADAEYATYQNDNLLSTAISKTKNYLQEHGAGAGKTALDFILPFDRTPTNIVLRSLDYTPLGFARSLAALRRMVQTKKGTNPALLKRLDLEIDKLDKEIDAHERMISSIDGQLEKLYKKMQGLSDKGNFEGYAKLAEEAKRLEDAKAKASQYDYKSYPDEIADLKKVMQRVFTRADQELFAKNMGRATGGTSAFIASGFALAAAGLMTGLVAPDDSDRTETSEFFRRRQKGIEPGSIYIPGVGRFQIGWSIPGRLMAIGASIYEETIRPRKGDASQSLASASGKIAGQGVKDIPLLNAVEWNVPKGKQTWLDTAGGLTSSFIPAFIRQAAEASDDQDRVTFGQGFWPQLQDKIPVWRESLKVSKAAPSYEERNKFKTEALEKMNPGGYLRRGIRQIDPFNTRSPEPFNPYNKEPIITSPLIPRVRDTEQPRRK